MTEKKNCPKHQLTVLMHWPYKYFSRGTQVTHAWDWKILTRNFCQICTYIFLYQGVNILWDHYSPGSICITGLKREIHVNLPSLATKTMLPRYNA